MKPLKIISVKELGYRRVYDITVEDNHSYITDNGLVHHNTTASDIKKMFIAPPGKLLLQLDYSQAELRVLAAASKEETMIDWFKRGHDVHLASACLKWDIDYDEAYIYWKDEDHEKHKEWKAKRKQAKCYSGDTEILTTSGWQRLGSYDNISKVAQYNFESECISFVTPENYGTVISKNNYTYQDRNIDFDITEDHQALYITRAGVKIKTEFKNLVGKSGSMPNAGYFKYDQVLDEYHTRFLSMYIADGNMNGFGKIRFGFSKTRKNDRCRYILDSLNIDYTYHYRKGVHHYYLPKKQNLSIYRLVEEYSDGKDLRWNNFLDIPGKIYLDESKNWDSYLDTNWKNDRANFSTINLITADIMQAMGSINGIRVIKKATMTKRGRMVYHLTYRPDGKTMSRVNLKNAKKYVTLGGKTMWSVTVPDRNLLIRKNGKTLLSGNTINFGIVYGQTARKLSANLSTDDYIVSLDEAQEFLDNFNEQFPAIADHIRRQQKYAKRNGYVYNLFGRKRRLPNVDSDNWGKKAEALRQAINAPIQGAASDFTLFSSVLIRDGIRKGTLPASLEQVGTVHDSLIFYINPEDIHLTIPKLYQICRNPETKLWFKFEIKGIEMKVEFEIGKNWGGLHGYNPQENYLA